MVDKYINEHGDVAVLVSGGWGAGWSTWDYEHGEALVFDTDVVKLILNNPPEYTNAFGHRKLTKETQDKITALVKKKYPGVYAGGVDQLEIEWLEPGTRFYIQEFDGNEDIITVDRLVYNA